MPEALQEERAQRAHEEYLWRLRNVPPTEGERSRMERDDMHRGQA